MNIAAGVPAGMGGGWIRKLKSTMTEKAMKRRPNRAPAILAAIFMGVI